MTRLPPSTLQQLARMICGEQNFKDFPRRSGSELTGFFTGLGFDYDCRGSSRLPFTVRALEGINNEAPPDAPYGLSENMKRIIVELMNPSAFLECPPGAYPLARDRINSLIGPLGFYVRNDEFERVELVPLEDERAKRLQTIRGASSSPITATTPDSPPTLLYNSAPSMPTHTGAISPPPEANFDIAVICALAAPELEKLCRIGKWTELATVRDDPNCYQVSEFQTRRGRRLRVVAAASTQMGMPAAAVLATKTIMRFRPKIVAIVGIAAGIKSEHQGFGDILAADRTFDYGAGKFTSLDNKLHFSPDPRPLAIDSRLLARLQQWSGKGKHFSEISLEWPAKRPPTALRMHVGPLGSGAAVLGTTEPIADTKNHWRKLIGIEMEAYGVHLACHTAVSPSPVFLCMKSVCDFADGKTDDWQDYAAHTAANAFHRFIVEEWEDLHLD